jgi:hypothetical protein
MEKTIKSITPTTNNGKVLPANYTVRIHNPLQKFVFNAEVYGGSRISDLVDTVAHGLKDDPLYGNRPLQLVFKGQILPPEASIEEEVGLTKDSELYFIFKWNSGKGGTKKYKRIKNKSRKYTPKKYKTRKLRINFKKLK